MEKNTSSNFRINSICPNCNALVEVRFAIQTDYKEAEPETKPEEKDNAERGKTGIESEKSNEGASVQPDNPEGKTGTTDSVPEPTDSGKSKANKRSGGKAK